MLKVILVASGKGGTGKTSFTAGVGAALAQLGHRVLLIDGDCGLRNLDIVLGMSDRVVYSFADVAGGAVQLGDAMARHPEYQTCTYSLRRSRCLRSASAVWSSWLCRRRKPALIICWWTALPGCLQSFLFWRTLRRRRSSSHRPIAPASAGRSGVRASWKRNIVFSAFAWCSTGCVRSMICRGKSGNIDDAMDEAGLPLLGVVPEDEDLISCGNSGKSILAVKHAGAARAFQNIARRLDGERVPLIRI